MNNIVEVHEDSVESNGSPEQARDLAEPTQPLLQWNLAITQSAYLPIKGFH